MLLVLHRYALSHVLELLALTRHRPLLLLLEVLYLYLELLDLQVLLDVRDLDDLLLLLSLNYLVVPHALDSLRPLLGLGRDSLCRLKLPGIGQYEIERLTTLGSRRLKPIQ